MFFLFLPFLFSKTLMKDLPSIGLCCSKKHDGV